MNAETEIIFFSFASGHLNRFVYLLIKHILPFYRILYNNLSLFLGLKNTDNAQIWTSKTCKIKLGQSDIE